MKLTRYGLDIESNTLEECALLAEMEAIKRDGKWTSKAGQAHGLGLSQHYENFRRICWPELDGEHNGQRWHKLCRDEIINNKVTVLMGPGSSGKTHEAAWVFLVEYWCFPQETCVLVSSTQVAQLRKRVWGELSDLWQRGVDKFDFLAGHLLDSAIAITTDDIQDVEPGERKIRDMRKGIFGIACVQGGKFVGLNRFVGIKQKRMRLVADEACFPAGTMVDTPTGKRLIEQIRTGDLILNALGVSKVKHTMKKRSERILKINTRDGRSVLCTPTHPFFTQKGWVCACELNQSHYMLSTYEAMQILRGGVQTNKQQQMLSTVQRGKDINRLQKLRKHIQKTSPEFQGEFLQSLLRVEIAPSKSSLSKEVLYCETNRQDSEISKGHVQSVSRKIRSYEGKVFCKHGEVYEFSNPSTEIRASEKAECYRKEAWNETHDSGRKRHWPNKSRNCPDGHVSGFEMEKQLSSQNRPEGWKRIPDMLQVGCGIAGIEIWSRSRRRLSHSFWQKRTGCQENKLSNGSWVDSVEIHQQKDIERLESGEIGTAVYNLEIEEHPSYSVNGFLVHNSWMGESFLSAFANLNKNVSFKAVVLGNPNDPIDPLGRAAEPAGGWTDEFMEPTKTKVWDTRFMNGRCVNLIGVDSPNQDYDQSKPPRFPYLISKKTIDETLSFFAKDSHEYYSQCVGSMKIGTMARRVLTRAMCLANKALEGVIWKGEQTTKVYFVDSSYGGDVCVAGWGEFGLDIDGKTLLSLSEPKAIPIRPPSGDIPEPEYQIANFVKADCEANEIPGGSMGHDSTGRGGLGTAIAKVWSADTHPIEFGGAATKRIVSLDELKLDEETGQRRHVLCNERYDRLISEFWYQFRKAVEAEQVRNLPEECLSDLTTRKWDRIKKDLISVEPKSRQSTDPNRQGMKQRTGKSPDYGDWAAGILEMARRKGFQISKLATPKQDDKSDNWLIDAEAEIESVLSESLLKHA